MKVGDSRDQAKSQPVSGTRTTSFKPVEPLEDMFVFGNGNSWPVVYHRNHGISFCLFDLYGHLPPFMSIFDGVIDQVRDRVEQEVSITPDKHPSISAHLEVTALFFRCSVK